MVRRTAVKFKPHGSWSASIVLNAFPAKLLEYTKSESAHTVRGPYADSCMCGTLATCPNLIKTLLGLLCIVSAPSKSNLYYADRDAEPFRPTECPTLVFYVCFPSNFSTISRSDVLAATRKAGGLLPLGKTSSHPSSYLTTIKPTHPAREISSL